MKRFALIIMTIATIFAQQVHAQYYSVNFDAKTVAAMVAAYGTVNPEKPDVPLNKNDAFQKVQKRRVQEKR